MKKAKTNNKIISILCAILSAVFALSMGLTYCVSSLSLEYGKSPDSISAYLGNQQYHLINDTATKPVSFGEGTHNFEIAIQYAIDYDFDVRVKYSLSWTNRKNRATPLSTDNVILNFVNRDNIIYDDEYIFLAKATSKGNGKIGLISGVEFVDVNAGEYEGESLTITILESDVKIKKAAGYADADNNALYTTALTTAGEVSVAAKAWLENKQQDSNFVTMYNYRRDYEHGVKYPDSNSAYRKDVVDQAVNKALWVGGNRSYAGLGMYVSTKDVVSFTISVAGIWRDSGDGDVQATAEGDTVEKDIYEDSARFNYAKQWTRTGWDGDKLWEIRTFDVYIPAETSCYIDILESVEITSGAHKDKIIDDAYRLVINAVTLNGQSFRFSNATNWIQSKELTTASGNPSVEPNLSTGAEGSPYLASDIEVVNTSLHNPGFYSAKPSGADGQSFDTSVSIINNSTSTQNLLVTATLWYHISNGQTLLFASESDKRRIEEYETDIDGNPMTDKKRFLNGLYFAYSLPTTTTFTKKITIAPTTSVNVWESFTAPAELQETVVTEFGTNYDVWAYLEINIKEATTEIPNESLQIETVQSGTAVDLFVKNDTDKIVEGVTIKDLTVKELDVVDYVLVTAQTDNPPADWKASFWKYYMDDQGTQQLTSPINYEKDKFYLKVQGYSTLTAQDITLNVEDDANKFEYTTIDDKECITSKIKLQPGECVKFASFTTTQTNKIYVSGNAVANEVTTPSDVMLIEAGTSRAYIHNTTANSYYVRFGGTYTGSNSNIQTLANNPGVDNTTYNYYIGVLRPGQIIEVPMSAVGTITSILAGSKYSSSDLKDWSTVAVAKMTELLT